MLERYVVSEYASVSWSGGDVQVASAVSAVVFTYRDGAVPNVLAAFSVPRAIDDVVRELGGDAAARIGEWVAAGILVDADVRELAAVHHWDRDSLASHATSRIRSWRKNPVSPAAPAVAPRRNGETIALATGEHGGELARLLDRRRSRREWGSAPIAFEAFSELFRMSARNRPTERTDHVSRPYPSAGAAYSLELYALVGEHGVEGVAAGVYRYLPDAHALEVVAPFGADVQRILVTSGKTAVTTPPPVVIVITSRYARLSEQYGRLAYTLVLKEVGCLFQTFYLCAESLGLAACALGRGTPAGLFARLAGTHELEEPVVGELAIGTI